MYCGLDLEQKLNQLFNEYRYVKQVATSSSTRFVYRRPCDELNEFQVEDASPKFILTVNMKDILYRTTIEGYDDMMAYLKLHLELQ